MFVAPEGDHYRTRLTHTLEVTGISRTVARALALNEDLAEAIGLGHDLGHPPFGHIGEDVLDRCMRERFGGHFHHWEQSLRVVDALERDGRGLNLTEQVRDGIVCHSGRAPEPATLEGAIVRITDRFAYLNHDIDDALRAGVLDARGAARRGDRRARRQRLGADRRARARPRRALAATAARSSRATRPRRRWSSCATSCSSTSTSARSRAASTRRSRRVVRFLFDHYCDAPGGAAARGTSRSTAA